MSPRVAFRYSLRELRGSLGRIWVWVACLSVGVGAVVSVAGLASSVDGAIRGEARKLLAADLALRSRGPIPAHVIEAVDAVPGAERAEVREMAAMAGRAAPRAPDSGAGASSLLVELKAVSGGYPFYGELEAAPPLPAGEEPGGSAGRPLGARVARGRCPGWVLRSATSSAWAGRRCGWPARWKGKPDRLPAGFAFGPRVVVGVAAQEAAGLFPFGGFGGYLGAAAAARGRFARGTRAPGRGAAGRDRRRHRGEGGDLGGRPARHSRGPGTALALPGSRRPPVAPGRRRRRGPGHSRLADPASRRARRAQVPGRPSGRPAARVRRPGGGARLGGRHDRRRGRARLDAPGAGDPGRRAAGRGGLDLAARGVPARAGARRRRVDGFLRAGSSRRAAGAARARVPPRRRAAAGFPAGDGAVRRRGGRRRGGRGPRSRPGRCGWPFASWAQSARRWRP